MLMEQVGIGDGGQKTAVKTFVSQRLRVLNINRVALSDLLKKSLSYMSQAESGTCNFPDDLVFLYSAVLKLDPEETQRFSDLVRLQNSRRSIKNQLPKVKELSALLDANGAILSDQALNEIESVIKAALTRSKVSFYRKGSPRGSRGSGPNRMTPERFLEINARLASFRATAVGKGRGYFCISETVEYADAMYANFQIVWCDKLPKRFRDAYACVETLNGLSTLYVTEELYRKACAKSSFHRHLMAHEMSHYLLGHAGTRLLAPVLVGTQKSTKLLDSDPAEELEANIGAVLLLVDWKILFRIEPSGRAQLIQTYGLDEESAVTTYFMMQNALVKYHLNQQM